MDKKTSIFGIILVVVGAMMLLSRFEIHLFHFLLPAALIIVGVWFIWRKRNRGDSVPPPPGGIYVHPTATRPEGINTGAAGGYPPPPPPPPPPFGNPWPSGPSATVSPDGMTASAGPGGPSATMGPSGMSASAGPSGPTASMGSSGAYIAPGATGPSAHPHFEGGKVKYSKFLGDMFIDCQNINMQNVEMSMFIGDLQVNLRGGKLSPGLNRLIISGFIGDIMIFVPQGYPVFVHCSGFVGDLDLLGRRSSGFGNTIDAQTKEYDSADAKIYVAVNNFVGDVRVYQI